MYKVSSYNNYFEKNGEEFMFNAHSGSYVKISPEYLSLLNKIQIGETALISEEKVQELLEAGFITDSSMDELGLYKYLRNTSRFSTKHFGLTIATTLQCNFRCHYCYEMQEDKYLEGEEEQRLINLVERELDGKKSFSVNWYGGEPLLNKDLITRLSKEFIRICEEKDVAYSAGMISNGYLLSRDIALEMVESNRVRHVQVTLDGGPESHNKSRVLVGGQGTFDKIINNIIDVHEIIKVNIRVNVTKQNKDNIGTLFKILMDSGLNNKVGLYLAPVTASTEVCQSISDNCLATKEFAEWEMELFEYADSLGFEIGNGYPRNRGGNICQAVNNNGFVVDADGDLYKCWHEVGNKIKKVGSIEKGITNKDNFFRWMNWELPEKCNDCSILPLCNGRCPDMSLRGNDFECHQLHYNFKERLHRFYMKKK
ncbi:MAG: radical protein [Paenibacillaceae bacterium]|jgi:uncharacterized protein|nr:radical protein [Paenibacillaceae bacterium]